MVLGSGFVGGGCVEGAGAAGVGVQGCVSGVDVAEAFEDVDFTVWGVRVVADGPAMSTILTLYKFGLPSRYLQSWP